MELIDSHCHLNHLKAEALDDILRRAQEVGIIHLLNVGTTLETFPNTLSLVHKHDWMSCSVGIQPSETSCREPTTEELVTLAKDPLVIALGETGLDYHYADTSPEIQKIRLRQHIRAARLVHKPLIIHLREASTDLFTILKEEKADEVGGILHCFTDTWEVAQQAMKLNFYISFSGIVTFPKAVNVQEVAQQVPLDKLLIETDSPYLAPVPMRGKPNEPSYLKYTAEFLSQLRHISLEELAQYTTNNFRTLFKYNS